MTREEQLKFCSVCKNRTFNPKQGIICSITNEIASFAGTCPTYIEDEQEVRIENRKVQSEKHETKRGINKGRYALFIIGGLYVIVGFLEAFVIEGHDLLFGIIDWIVAVVFIGLGIWSYRKASLAYIIGLGFYITIILLLFAVEPTSIINGVIWKVLVIYSLIYGIRTARSEEAKYKTRSVDLLDQI